MHQQWKKHSGFSEHIYAENSRRRFCLSEFSTVDIQTGLPSQFLAGVLKLTKRVWGELCCQLIQGFTSCQGCLRMRQEEEAKHSEREKGRK